MVGWECGNAIIIIRLRDILSCFHFREVGVIFAHPMETFSWSSHDGLMETMLYSLKFYRKRNVTCHMSYETRNRLIYRVKRTGCDM